MKTVPFNPLTPSMGIMGMGILGADESKIKTGNTPGEESSEVGTQNKAQTQPRAMIKDEEREPKVETDEVERAEMEEARIERVRRFRTQQAILVAVDLRLLDGLEEAHARGLPFIVCMRDYGHAPELPSALCDCAQTYGVTLVIIP